MSFDFKIIATDFDGTLCANNWPEIGEPNQKVLDYLKAEKEKGSKIILWTNRVDEKLDEAVHWCDDQGLSLDAVNANLPEVVEAFGADSRKIFAHEYIDDRASTRFCLSTPEEEGGMFGWAKNEVERACKKELEMAGDKPQDADYGIACYESALRAYQSLCRDGHSGASIQITKNLLNRLINGQVLSPIEDTPDIWNEVANNQKTGSKRFQCRRMSSLFKEVDAEGNVLYTDIDRVHSFDLGNPDVSFYSPLALGLVDQLFPITMPYFPTLKKFKVVQEEFLVDPKFGDFDTVGLLHILCPDGSKVELNRFFKETKAGMKTITQEEYEARKAKKIG